MMSSPERRRISVPCAGLWDGDARRAMQAAAPVKIPMKALVLERAPTAIPLWINHHKASIEHPLLNAEPLLRLPQPRIPILRFEDQMNLLFLYFFRGILLP